MIIPRSEHSISRANISPNALKVLYHLNEAGHEAYLVGGSVRDLLLGREPKDFDVATSAHPDTVRALFRNSRLIGRRFRLAHVRYGREIVEVATFRAQHDAHGEGGRVAEDGMLVRDNVYGTLEDDAWRRDFTINALYYDVRDFSVVDYTCGLQDLRDGVLRLIGEPEQRFHEDPVRMLRAVRFGAKLGFRLEDTMMQAMHALGVLLEAVPPARLFDEVLKLFQGGVALTTFELMRHYGLFGHLFPETERALATVDEGPEHNLLPRALGNTDARIAAGKPVTPAFLFAALMWPPVRHRVRELEADGASDLEALQEAGQVMVERQAQRVAFPRRFSAQSREIWAMQARLPRRGGKRPARLFEHPRFRAAYDFLLLRHAAGEEGLGELCDWWTKFQESDHADQQTLRPTSDTARSRHRRPRKRRRAGSSPPPPADPA